MSKFARNSGSRFTSPAPAPVVTPPATKKKEYPTIIGNVLIPKNADENKKSLLNEAAEACRNEKAFFNIQVNLPKGVEEVTLKRGDILFMSFFKFKTDKDFVVGHVSLPNNEE